VVEVLLGIVVKQEVEGHSMVLVVVEQVVG
jgi:hypothetical protein